MGGWVLKPLFREGQPGSSSTGIGWESNWGDSMDGCDLSDGHHLTGSQHREESQGSVMVSVDRQGKQCVRTVVWLVCPIRNGKRWNWAPPQHSSRQGWVPKVGLKWGSWEIFSGCTDWGLRWVCSGQLGSTGPLLHLTRTVPGVTWRPWLWKQWISLVASNLLLFLAKRSMELQETYARHKN